ncbi:ATP-binding protein [Lachnoclostridium sp. Marseille-P6806]|uniref:ATP-binding protein n=1 Tax=Lachnoclostridium sp. Marseille-P6806 TaxID=2364793 RepID=UPI0010300DDC|nr:ATP-binding protein [Lachnoclostridium sp. Marseille-P6806]
MQTPIEFGRSFLNAYYRNRDTEECLGYLGEDIIWVTPGDAVHLREREEISRFAGAQIEANEEPYYVDVAETMSDPVAENIRALTYVCALVPKDPSRAKQIRVTLVIRGDAEGMAITSLHISRRYRQSDTSAFTEFLERLPDEHMVVQSRSGQNLKLLSSNRRLMEELGYPEKEYRSRSKKDPFFMFREQDRKRIRRTFSSPAEGERRFRVTAREKGGRRRGYELIGRLGPEEDGRRTAYLIFFDVTAQNEERAKLGRTISTLSEMADHQPCETAVVRCAAEKDAEAGGAYACTPLFLSRNLPALFGLEAAAFEQELRKDMFYGLELQEVTKEYYLRRATAGADREAELEKTVCLHRGDGKPDRRVRLSVYGCESRDEAPSSDGGAKESESRPAYTVCLYFVDVTEDEQERERLEFDAKRRVRAAEVREQEEKQAALRAAEEAGKQIEEAKRYTTGRLAELEEMHATETEANRARFEEELEAARQQCARLQEIAGTLRTEKKAAETERDGAKEEAERALRSRGDFLSRMHRDLRAPAAAILSLVKTAGEAEDEAAFAASMGKIREAAGVMQRQVDRLLEMAELEAGERELAEEEFVFRDLMRELEERAAEACGTAGIEFHAEQDEAIPEIMLGDRAAIAEVLTNLLDNAVKFTGRGGQVRLRAEQGQPQSGRIPLRFSVIDTGIGIREDLMPVLFDPFVRGERADGTNEGFGLGLAAAERLVRMMDGGIGASSTPGVGSYFTVTLSLKPSTAESGRTRTARELRLRQAAEGASRRGDGLAGRRVLLAEDDPLNIEVIRHLLEKKGAIVDKAAGGRAAAAEFCAAEKDYYDAVLVDYSMPGTDGLAAARQIRAAEAERGAEHTVPIVALTANSFEEDMAASFAGLIDAGLAKPVEPKKLFELLRALLRRGTAAESGERG